MNRNELNHRLPGFVDAITRSVLAEPRTRHLDRVLLPNRDTIVDCIERLRQLAFPGYFGKQGLTTENLPYRVGELLDELQDMLYDQVRCCLRYREHLPGSDAADVAPNGGTNGSVVAGSGTGVANGIDGRENGGGATATLTVDAAAAVSVPATVGKSFACDLHACDIVSAFLERLPAVREVLAEDVQAAFDGDPAAGSTDEAIFCYPGLFAIFVQRVAHVFYELKVPLLPRIMTEYAHNLTGIDMHPGAKLGRRFFIDHGTGVVIGETAEIGNNVKIYQGVTLGALSPAAGQLLRGHRRHPTIEDDVTIYAGATILGGETVIGRGAVIGGNVFVTSSVPAFNLVSAEPPKLKYRERRQRGRQVHFVPDFQI